jgi:hypothetical protein
MSKQSSWADEESKKGGSVKRDAPENVLDAEPGKLSVES